MLVCLFPGYVFASALYILLFYIAPLILYIYHCFLGKKHANTCLLISAFLLCFCLLNIFLSNLSAQVKHARTFPLRLTLTLSEAKELIPHLRVAPESMFDLYVATSKSWFLMEILKQICGSWLSYWVPRTRK